MKKIKNPDLLIQRLRAKIERLERTSSFWQEELRKARMAGRGEFWFTYSDGVEQSVNIQTLELAQRVRIGEKINLRAEVIEIKKDGEAYPVKFRVVGGNIVRDPK